MRMHYRTTRELRLPFSMVTPQTETVLANCSARSPISFKVKLRSATAKLQIFLLALLLLPDCP